MKVYHKMILVLIASILSLMGQETKALDTTSQPVNLVKEAYRSKNIKTIEKIILNPTLKDQLLLLLRKEPSSPWKDEVILTLMESPWSWDQQPGKPSPPSGIPPLDSYQLAIELLSPILVKEKLKIDNVATYRKLANIDYRKKLVEKYRKIKAGEETREEILNILATKLELENSKNDFADAKEKIKTEAFIVEHKKLIDSLGKNEIFYHFELAKNLFDKNRPGLQAHAYYAAYLFKKFYEDYTNEEKEKISGEFKKFIQKGWLRKKDVEVKSSKN